MTTFYRIRYKIQQDGKTMAAVALTELTVEEWLQYARRNFRDATLIFCELVEKVEVEDSASSETSLVICFPHDHQTAQR